MVIRKDYDVKQLAEKLNEEVERSKKYNGIVKLDILTAYHILQILQETIRREERNQTLESALSFIEKEDGTQTNEMEEQNKVRCFGKYDNREYRKPNCFGKYDEDEDQWDDCREYCQYYRKCIEESKNA